MAHHPEGPHCQCCCKQEHKSGLDAGKTARHPGSGTRQIASGEGGLQRHRISLLPEARLGCQAALCMCWTHAHRARFSCLHRGTVQAQQSGESDADFEARLKALADRAPAQRKADAEQVQQDILALEPQFGRVPPQQQRPGRAAPEDADGVQNSSGLSKARLALHPTPAQSAALWRVLQRPVALHINWVQHTATSLLLLQGNQTVCRIHASALHFALEIACRHLATPRMVQAVAQCCPCVLRAAPIWTVVPAVSSCLIY